MKLLRVLLIAALLPALTFAQRGGGARGGGGGSRGGGFSSGGARISGGYGGRVGAYGYGYGRYGYGYRGYYGGLYLGFGFGWPYYGYGYYPYYGYPYGYPYYDYGYPYYDPYYYAAPYDYGPVTYSQPAPQQPVVVQQTIQPPANESFYRTPDFYLIAFTDHTIRAAVSYDVQGDQIHWVDREHEEHSAPLNTVDRAFSAQINRDRRVEFRLP